MLNAKYHEREAEIVAQAGREGAVTIATNMAGRGTDILLGGNPEFLARGDAAQARARPATRARGERASAWRRRGRSPSRSTQQVVELGGLHILGTERHESRRIDNQLRGRSGRQGDPGSSRFYLSLEDDLLRIFGSERIQKIMDRLGMEEGEPIEHRLVTRAIETAQKRVETHNFEIRKHLLEYDDVMNKQREIIYGMRREILEGESQEETVAEWIEEIARAARRQRYAPAKRTRGLGPGRARRGRCTGSSMSASRGARCEESHARAALEDAGREAVQRALRRARGGARPRMLCGRSSAT